MPPPLPEQQLSLTSSPLWDIALLPTGFYAAEPAIHYSHENSLLHGIMDICELICICAYLLPSLGN